MRAAEMAQGRYLKYVDSDDLIYRHSLEIMVEAMEAENSALVDAFAATLRGIEARLKEAGAGP